MAWAADQRFHDVVLRSLSDAFGFWTKFGFVDISDKRFRVRAVLAAQIEELSPINGQPEITRRHVRYVKPEINFGLGQQPTARPPA